MARFGVRLENDPNLSPQDYQELAAQAEKNALGAGMEAEGGLGGFDDREVRVGPAILAHSRRVYLATDHSKFGRNAMVQLGSLAQLDALFTDQPVPRAIDELLAAEGVTCHVAATADDVDE